MKRSTMPSGIPADVRLMLEPIRPLVLAAYLGTPLFLIFRWIRVAKAQPPRRVWPVPAALGMWLAQAALLAYVILMCVSGHCTPPVAEPVLLAVMALAYAGIGWMLWLSRRTIAK
jgi:hypothetical protein